MSARSLTDELDSRGSAYRNERALQEDFAQPVGELILDILAVTLHSQQAGAYQRLTERLTPNTGDDEADARNAARWRKALGDSRAQVQSILSAEEASEELFEIIRSFLDAAGSDILVSLSPEYGAGDPWRGSSSPS